MTEKWGHKQHWAPRQKRSTWPRFRRLCNGRNDNSHNSALAESGILLDST